MEFKARRRDYHPQHTVAVGYCCLQCALRVAGLSRESYTASRIDGWRSDQYRLPNYNVISEGYAPIGRYPMCGFTRILERLARRIDQYKWSRERKAKRMLELLEAYTRITLCDPDSNKINNLEEAVGLMRKIWENEEVAHRKDKDKANYGLFYRELQRLQREETKRREKQEGGDD